jgi:hypothetical protein
MSKQRGKRTNKEEQIKQCKDHKIRREKMVVITERTREKMYKECLFKQRI